MPKSITVYLQQSLKTMRWYYSSNSFQSHTKETLKGKPMTYLTKRGSDSDTELPEDAITVAFLDIEWNSWSEKKILKHVPKSCQMNPATGDLIF